MHEDLGLTDYADRVERNLEGLHAVSVGACNTCQECKDTLPEISGELVDEGGFSWSPCGLCNSRLGGDRYVWHALDRKPGPGAALLHFDDACADCVQYIANGVEPEP